MLNLDRNARKVGVAILLSIVMMASLLLSYQIGRASVPEAGPYYLDDPFGTASYYIDQYSNGSTFVVRGTDWHNVLITSNAATAINYAIGAVTTGGRIFIRDGDYNVGTTSIVIDKEIILEGENPSIHGPNDDYATKIYSSTMATNDCVIQVDARCTIKNLFIDHAKSTGGCGINFSTNVQSCSLYDVSVRAYGTPIYLTGQNHLCRFYNVRAHKGGVASIAGSSLYMNWSNGCSFHDFYAYGSKNLINLTDCGTNTFHNLYLSTWYATATTEHIISLENIGYGSTRNYFYSVYFDPISATPDWVGFHFDSGCEYNRVWIQNDVYLDTLTDDSGFHNYVESEETGILEWPSPYKYYLPLAYRMDEDIIVYYDAPWFIVRSHVPGAANLTNHFGSWITMGMNFTYGKYEWKGLITNPAARIVHYMGFEKHHGWGNEGMIIAACQEGTYSFRTYNDTGGLETTNLGGEDWTSEKTFMVNWTANYCEFYVDDVLKANHTKVPTAPIFHFLGEVGTYHSPMPAVEGFVYVKNHSFREVD